MESPYSMVVLVCSALTVCGTTFRGFGADFEAPAPRRRTEVEAVLAKAPGLPAKEELRTLRVVLLADVKDHGPDAHDYPLWQKRWALLLGGRRAAGDSVKQVNLFGPVPEGDPGENGVGDLQRTYSEGLRQRPSAADVLDRQARKRPNFHLRSRTLRVDVRRPLFPHLALEGHGLGGG